MQAAEALVRLGGVAETGALLGLTTPRRIRRAVRRGEILRPARGRYVLPSASEAHHAAAAVSGVVALRSAAAHYGWKTKQPPPVPEVIVPRNRKVDRARRESCRLMWVSLAQDQVADGVTKPLRTVIDCARRLPFDEALAIGDSALRSGDVTRADLDGIDVRGAGADAVRRVLRRADGRAANPFESVLRALCIEAGLEVVPQVPVDLGTGRVRPDLVCPSCRIVLEADSWTHHATRRAHTRDCARYNLLVLHDWRVLRFTWEQVMLDQRYVRWVLGVAVRRVGRAEVSTGFPASA
ncbi:endonuclease domain-containing protein [Nocardioides sp. LHG3406-4]|uniref:endonuclease domain-containing protein n=1 Tax=Nocardioides sp. LHG3406-4 TaxID=2804575 RepID=UPI003CF971E9